MDRVEHFGVEKIDLLDYMMVKNCLTCEHGDTLITEGYAYWVCAHWGGFVAFKWNCGVWTRSLLI